MAEIPAIDRGFPGWKTMTTASGNMNIDDLSETNGLTALLGEDWQI